jgi:adenylosuccinate lyase
VKDGAPRNDMLERLEADPAFPVPMDDLRTALEPSRFIGRAAEQVTEFLRDEVQPLLQGHAVASGDEALRV